MNETASQTMEDMPSKVEHVFIKKETNNLICSICLDDTQNNLPKMITQCNHFYHRHCYHRANYKKVEYSCPYCRQLNPMQNLIEIYQQSQIPDSLLFYFKLIKDLVRNFKLEKYFISGSFAIFLYQTLHQMNPKWKFNDIDIYYFSKDEIQIEKYIPYGNYLIINETTTEFTDQYNAMLCVRSVNKISIYIQKKKQIPN
jgi:hypothetical protein